MGPQIFENSGSHLKILGVKRVKWSIFQTQDLQILGTNEQNLVALMTWYPDLCILVLLCEWFNNNLAQTLPALYFCMCMPQLDISYTKTQSFSHNNSFGIWVQELGHIYCFKSYGNKHTNGSAKSDTKFLNKLHLRAVVVAAAAATAAAPSQMNRTQSTPQH